MVVEAVSHEEEAEWQWKPCRCLYWRWITVNSVRALVLYLEVRGSVLSSVGPAGVLSVMKVLCAMRETADLPQTNVAIVLCQALLSIWNKKESALSISWLFPSHSPRLEALFLCWADELCWGTASGDNWPAALSCWHFPATCSLFTNSNHAARLLLEIPPPPPPLTDSKPDLWWHLQEEVEEEGVGHSKVIVSCVDLACPAAVHPGQSIRIAIGGPSTMFHSEVEVLKSQELPGDGSIGVLSWGCCGRPNDSLSVVLAHPRPGAWLRWMQLQLITMVMVQSFYPPTSNLLGPALFWVNYMNEGFMLVVGENVELD